VRNRREWLEFPQETCTYPPRPTPPPRGGVCPTPFRESGAAIAALSYFLIIQRAGRRFRKFTGFPARVRAVLGWRDNALILDPRVPLGCCLLKRPAAPSSVRSTAFPPMVSGVLAQEKTKDAGRVAAEPGLVLGGRPLIAVAPTWFPTTFAATIVNLQLTPNFFLSSATSPRYS